MHIKSILAGAAIALAAGLASASAADQWVEDADGVDSFTILRAIPAVVITTPEAAQVRGRLTVYSMGVSDNTLIAGAGLGFTGGPNGSVGIVCLAGGCSHPGGATGGGA